MAAIAIPVDNGCHGGPGEKDMNGQHQIYNDTEMGEAKVADPRRTGGLLTVAGVLFIVLGVLVVLMDLPTLGGEVYGSHGQNTVLCFMIGAMLMLAGYLNLRAVP